MDYDVKHIPFQGWGNSTVVTVSVCQAGRPGSCPAQSACFRKVEFYQGAIDLFPPVLMTGSTKAVCYHVYVIMHVKDP